MVVTSLILTKGHIITEIQIRTRAMLQLIKHIITGYKVKGYLSLFSAISICLARNLKWIYQNVTQKPCAFLSFKYLVTTILCMCFAQGLIIIVKEIKLKH